MSALDPSVLAAFDQEYADTKRYLRDVMRGYEEMRTENAAAGIPDYVSVVGLCAALGEAVSDQVLATVLAVAVVELTKAGWR